MYGLQTDAPFWLKRGDYTPAKSLLRSIAAKVRGQDWIEDPEYCVLYNYLRYGSYQDITVTLNTLKNFMERATSREEAARSLMLSMTRDWAILHVPKGRLTRQLYTYTEENSHRLDRINWLRVVDIIADFYNLSVPRNVESFLYWKHPERRSTSIVYVENHSQFAGVIRHTRRIMSGRDSIFNRVVVDAPLSFEEVVSISVEEILKKHETELNRVLIFVGLRMFNANRFYYLGENY